MFGPIPLMLALVLGCTTTPDPAAQPDAAAANAGAERAAPPGSRGKARGKASKSGKAGAKGAPSRGGAKARSKQGGKAPARGAKGGQAAAKGGAKAAAAKGKAGQAKGKGGKAPAEAAPPIGIAGPIAGTLTLTAAGEGEAVKTTAALALTWEGGEKALPLGDVSGTCTEQPPEPIKTESASVTPLWLVACDGTGKFDAKIAIAQHEDTLSIRRAKIDGEKVSPWRTLKRVKLVEGATVSKGGGQQ